MISKRHIRRKSVPQNNTIHGLIRQLCEHTGDEFEYLKECFKDQYGPVEKIRNKIVPGSSPGAFLERPKSIADYNSDEANAFIEKILYVAADHFGVTLEID